MPNRRSLLRRLKLRTILVVALLLAGIIPLGISSTLLIRQSRDVLSKTERDNLTAEAEALSREVNSYLVAVRQQVMQIGNGILAMPGPEDPSARLREPWVGEHLKSLRSNPDMVALRVLDPALGEGLGPSLSREVEAVMDAAFEEARTRKAPAYRVVGTGTAKAPQAILAVPVPLQGKPRLIVEAQFRFVPLERFAEKEESEGVGVFLIDRKGKVLWESGGQPPDPALIQAFVSRPLTMTWENEVSTPDGPRDVFSQVSDIQESGWGLVVQKPLLEAFADVDRMLYNAILSTILLVALSLFFSYLAARWVSHPIQRLTDTTHEIADGNFGGRVAMQGLTFELADLAEDFNRMSGHVETYVQQLRQAAQANRELFIGSLRAFVAAVDAKDPYTRGHSERVAAYSRTIARYLQLPEEVQHKIWIGALLHDVGKIGVEDRILRKEGVLAPDEYEQMKLHTVMGAEIMTPIEQLREMVPAIRSHHEAWNGRGYPDGLKGEQIPLFARIVGVADTFDAITTNRPYQQAYSLQFAVETITRLTGSRFDAKVVTAFLRAFE
ncbi:MAG TPA: HD domain-containing phosphohydrolase, partial [Thermoanaerobaculia bacterium]|nr:HD domain-containing phosphohydrolase [Thermoanaerobaculia bacterium]